MIEENELPKLQQNGCDRIHLKDLGGHENEIMGEFGFKAYALNYKYRPDPDPHGVIKANPFLQFLPSAQEANAR